MELLFASDRLACSIFVPTILGMKLTLFCALPPGGSANILQEDCKELNVNYCIRTLSFMLAELAIVFFIIIFINRWQLTQPKDVRKCSAIKQCTTQWHTQHSFIHYSCRQSWYCATRTFSANIDKDLDFYLKLTLPWISPAPATVRIPLTGWEKWLMKVTTAVCSLLRMTEFSSATWKREVCQDFCVHP